MENHELGSVAFEPSSFILSALSVLHVPEILQALRERKSIPKIPFIKRPLLNQLAQLVEAKNLNVEQIVSTGQKRQAVRLSSKVAKRKRTMNVARGPHFMSRAAPQLRRSPYQRKTTFEEWNDPSWTPDMDSPRRKRRKLTHLYRSKKSAEVKPVYPRQRDITYEILAADDQINWIKENPLVDSEVVEKRQVPERRGVVESGKFWAQLNDRLEVKQSPVCNDYKENEAPSVIPQLSFMEPDLSPGWTFRLNSIAKEQNFGQQTFNVEKPWIGLEDAIRSPHWYCDVDASNPRRLEVNPKQFERIQRRRNHRTTTKRLQMLKLLDSPATDAHQAY